jgi:hypothetical protein
VSISSKLVVYYGSGELSALERFELVALQPGHYSSAELKQLRDAGSTPLAYLSLGEDVGSAAPWQRSEKNPDWHGHYVQAGHPGWGEQLRTQAEALLTRGFGGFLLDTLDTVDLFPDDRDAYLRLVASIRSLTPSAYLLANRGFSLLPELAEHIDGLLFEAFSSTWQADGTTQALSPADLFFNTEITTELEPLGLDLYALDYADTPALEAFARDRAASHRLTSLISSRDLTRLPG